MTVVFQSKEGKKAKNFSESHKTSHCELAIFLRNPLITHSKLGHISQSAAPIFTIDGSNESF